MAERQTADELVAYARELRNREARTYDRRMDRRGRELLLQTRAMMSALDLAEGQVALDAGSGTGRHLAPLLERASRVIAADYSAASLDVARERVEPGDRERVEFIEADVRELPLEDASVDRALCAEVMGDLATDDMRAAAAAELRRVLRPGGVVVISGYRWLVARRRRSGVWDSGLLYHAFTPRELRALLRDAGFADVRLGGTPILPQVTKRLQLSDERHTALAFTPVGRALGYFILARARRA